MRVCNTLSDHCALSPLLVFLFFSFHFILFSSYSICLSFFSFFFLFFFPSLFEKETKHRKSDSQITPTYSVPNIVDTYRLPSEVLVQILCNQPGMNFVNYLQDSLRISSTNVSNVLCTTGRHAFSNLLLMAEGTFKISNS